MRFLLITFITNLALLACSGADAKEQESIFFATPWSSKCQETPPSNVKACILEKYIFADKNQKKRVGAVVVRTSSQNNDSVITLISPLGVALSPGVEIEIGGEKIKSYPFIFCDERGCVSQFIAEDRTMTLLSSKKIMSLKYQLLNRNSILINIDLENFKSLYSEIKQ